MTQDEQAKMDSELLARSIDNVGYLQLLGVHIETAQAGLGRVSIEVDRRLMHAHQVVHGGVIFTLADTAMAIALLPAYPPGTRTSTIEAKINFLLPVRTGTLLAEAMPVHEGRSTVVMEATVYNIHESERKAIARVLGTFNIARPKSPAPGE